GSPAAPAVGDPAARAVADPRPPGVAAAISGRAKAPAAAEPPAAWKRLRSMCDTHHILGPRGGWVPGAPGSWHCRGLRAGTRAYRVPSGTGAVPAPATTGLPRRPQICLTSCARRTTYAERNMEGTSWRA